MGTPRTTTTTTIDTPQVNDPSQNLIPSRCDYDRYDTDNKLWALTRDIIDGTQYTKIQKLAYFSWDAIDWRAEVADMKMERRVSSARMVFVGDDEATHLLSPHREHEQAFWFGENDFDKLRDRYVFHGIFCADTMVIGSFLGQCGKEVPEHVYKALIYSKDAEERACLLKTYVHMFPRALSMFIKYRLFSELKFPMLRAALKLYECSETVRRFLTVSDDTVMVYKLDKRNNPVDAMFPEYGVDPDTLIGHNYVGRLMMILRDQARESRTGLKMYSDLKTPASVSNTVYQVVKDIRDYHDEMKRYK